MADRREQILARLVEIFDASNDFVTVKRNTLNLDKDLLPALVVFDADETNADFAGMPTWTPKNRAQMMTMRPEIYIVISDKQGDVGTTLNRLRSVAYRAIVGDNQLHAIVGDNGRIVLGAMHTALATGRKMSGELKLSFEFTYPLMVKDLVITGSANPYFDDIIVG